MAWSSPRTWVAAEVPTAAIFNTHVRDNLTYLFSGRAGSSVLRDNGSSYTTTSASFANIDVTNITQTVTINSGKALVYLTGTVAVGSTTTAAFDIAVDGTRIGASGTNGLAVANMSTGTLTVPICLIAIKTGLSVGSHTFVAQWLSTAGVSISFYSGNGSGGQDVIPSLGVLEIG